MDEPLDQPSGVPGESPQGKTGVQLPLWPQEYAAPDATSEADALAGEPVPGETTGQAVPWSLRDLGAFVLFAVLSFLLANVAALTVFIWLRDTLLWETTVEEVFHKTSFVVSMQIVWEVLWFLFIYFTVTRKYRQTFLLAIRWAWGPAGRLHYLLAGAGLALGAQMLFSVFPSEKQLPIERLFSSPESAYLLAVFGICVAPFAEELVFRGFFYPVFERLWGFVAAVVITALLFAFVHMPQLSGGWLEILAIFGVGLAFSYCRGKTGSLVPPYLMHLAYNASLFVWLYIATDRFRSLGNL